MRIECERGVCTCLELRPLPAAEGVRLTPGAVERLQRVCGYYGTNGPMGIARLCGDPCPREREEAVERARRLGR